MITIAEGDYEMTFLQMIRRHTHGLRLVLLLPVAALCCFGQLATVQGEVRDPSNAVVPGAAVKVTNVKTGVSQTTSTNQSGYYSVPSMIPGSYTVEATAKGFQTSLYRVSLSK